MTEQDDFAHRLTHVLDSGVNKMDAGTLERLAQVRRHAVTPSRSMSAGHTVVALLHRHAYASTFLALLLALSGWWIAQNSTPSYSAETDILLLTGDLPPNAYADKTFAQWLDTRSTY